MIIRRRAKEKVYFFSKNFDIDNIFLNVILHVYGSNYHENTE